MSFSLIPSWSKELKVKFATHNARLETVTEKPIWKTPFLSQHCLIPLTSFFESVYEVPLAGNIIQFTESKNDLLFAAGLFDAWKDPVANRNIFSFSILTTDPTAFIKDHGHDRSPIFLIFENAKTWLDLRNDTNKMVEFLAISNLRPDLIVQIDRSLKAGWEKRK